MWRPQRTLRHLGVLLLCHTIPLLSASEQEMTVEVPPGQEDCFFQTVEAGKILDVEYQVVDGGQHNELEINFRIIRPEGVPLVADFRKSDNAHRQSVPETGDYKICFDNTISRFNAKTVFFEVIVESENDDDENEFGDLFEGVTEGTYDVQIEDIEVSLKEIKERITRSRHMQDQIRNFEYRDRSIAEHNFERVNFWSIVHVILLVSAGLIQVVLVRSLFDEKSALHRMWKNFF